MKRQEAEALLSIPVAVVTGHSMVDHSRTPYLVLGIYCFKCIAPFDAIFHWFAKLYLFSLGCALSADFFLDTAGTHKQDPYHRIYGTDGSLQNHWHRSSIQLASELGHLKLGPREIS